jgi:hypothetical protein
MKYAPPMVYADAYATLVMGRTERLSPLYTPPDSFFAHLALALKEANVFHFNFVEWQTDNSETVRQFTLDCITSGVTGKPRA